MCCLFLQVTQFLRLARDCQIIDGVPTELSGSITKQGRRGQRNVKSKSPLVLEEEKKKRRLGPAVVNLAFASVLRRRFRAPTVRGKKNQKAVGRVDMSVWTKNGLLGGKTCLYWRETERKA